MLNSFLQAVTNVNDTLNNLVWGWPMIILILGAGLLLTIRTKVMQVRRFGESISATIVPTLKSIGKPQTSDQDAQSVSQFEAFATAISGTVGTGNIVGVVSAILTGGPGAVFWMWASAFFGMITNYAENVLGLYYRRKDQDGNFSGGAFYYITYGLRCKWLGLLAAAFCMLAALGMSGVQTNKISGALSACFGVNAMAFKLVVGVAVAALTALIILKGIKRIGRVASMLVPFMSVLFIALSLIAIGMNISAVPEAFRMIFSNIFGFKAMAGGFGGYVFAQVIKKGMARGRVLQ